MNNSTNQKALEESKMASLGQELKKAREDLGISLHDISDSTNIGVRFLQAIESDNYDILPGGVFNRAFVKKFASIVNFDESQALKLYDEQLGEMGGEPQRRYYTGIDEIDMEPRAGNGLLLSLLALIILSAGAYLAYEYFKGPEKPSEQVPNQGSLNTGTVEASQAAVISPPDSGSTVEALNDLKVQLIANADKCWVGVRTDKSQQQQQMMNPGDRVEFKARDSLVLNIGNMPAVSIWINGRLADPEKLAPNRRGAVAENIIITKENYQQFVE